MKIGCKDLIICRDLQTNLYSNLPVVSAMLGMSATCWRHVAATHKCRHFFATRRPYMSRHLQHVTKCRDMSRHDRNSAASEDMSCHDIPNIGHKQLMGRYSPPSALSPPNNPNPPRKPWNKSSSSLTLSQHKSLRC